MGNSSPRIKMSEDLKKAVDGVKKKARTYVRLGEKWRDFRKPLGARNRPGIPPTPGSAIPVGLVLKGVNVVAGYAGHAFGTQGAKGRALRLNASIAGEVQNEIVSLTQSIDKLSEPQRSINLSYLQHIADATILAARACQKLCCGRSPSDKHRTKLAVAWVVLLACSVVAQPVKANLPAALLDKRVKEVANKAYRLFSAGKKLNETVDPAEAIHMAYVALDLA